MTETATEIQGVFVSHLKNNGKQYVIVVSHDPFNKQKITLFPKTGLPIIEKTPPTAPDITSPDQGSDGWIRTLDPGGYAIFEW